MAIKSSITPQARFAMAIRNHIENFGKDNKCNCIVFNNDLGFLVDSFIISQEFGPMVCLSRSNSESEIKSHLVPVTEFNEDKCKTLLAVIEENADALTYQLRSEAMNRHSKLANSAEKLIKEYFDITRSNSKLIVQNKISFYIGKDKINYFSFNPEKNKSFGGEYDLICQGGKKIWIWDLKSSELEKLSELLQDNIKLAQKQRNAKSNGVKM